MDKKDKLVKLPTKRGQEKLGSLMKKGRGEIGSFEVLEDLIEETIGNRVPRATLNQLERGTVLSSYVNLTILAGFAEEYFKRTGIKFLFNTKISKPYLAHELWQILTEEIEPEI